MIIRSEAPMRVDLAGGTLDIYPLYLFTEGGLTLNAAVTLMSEAVVESRDDGRVLISAEDLGEEIEADSIDALSTGGRLDLLVRLVKFFRPGCGLTVRTKNNVPKGSGLGASSSLLIALSHALNRLCGNQFAEEEIINYGANIEAQCIRIPTGKQDYYSATYGGASVIWFNVLGARRESAFDSPAMLQALEDRLVVSFAGEPRDSAVGNWSMFRAYVDGDKRAVSNIMNIKKTAMKMLECLREGRLDDFGALLDEEWKNRRELAPGVTNDRIERQMAVAARAGAEASKICGAGGGGAMISFCSPGAKDSVSSALRSEGVPVFDCGIAGKGVTVTQL
ncbi:MAG: D-glycero-alpha-D-manno-heptose 7-phosphate kinase [bacterium ADurb.Bin236]|mgnify:FL=1|nr:MAG: D-glycero-alpha-D-manno-heptose 7-phosphate kinase [bacterium ADurb.Bin236]HOY64036.1 hypothetical protein [bacterium]